MSYNFVIEPKMNIINLTPHAITIIDYGTVEPSGTVARVITDRHEITPVNGIRVVVQSPGEISGLPQPQPDTIYVVSAAVQTAVTGRSDVYAPDTGLDAVRNDAGHITAVRGLTQYNTKGVS